MGGFTKTNVTELRKNLRCRLYARDRRNLANSNEAKDCKLVVGNWSWGGGVLSLQVGNTGPFVNPAALKHLKMGAGRRFRKPSGVPDASFVRTPIRPGGRPSGSPVYARTGVRHPFSAIKSVYFV